MKFKIETIAIQDSKKTKFKSHYCCNNQNLTVRRLATPSSRLRPDGSRISHMRVYIHMKNLFCYNHFERKKQHLQLHQL
jgi:hypothetical protein